MRTIFIEIAVDNTIKFVTLEVPEESTLLMLIKALNKKLLEENILQEAVVQYDIERMKPFQLKDLDSPLDELGILNFRILYASTKTPANANFNLSPKSLAEYERSRSIAAVKPSADSSRRMLTDLKKGSLAASSTTTTGTVVVHDIDDAEDEEAFPTLPEGIISDQEVTLKFLSDVKKTRNAAKLELFFKQPNAANVALLCAADTGDKGLLQLALTRGADINYMAMWNVNDSPWSADILQVSALMLAVIHGHEKILESLVTTWRENLQLNLENTDQNTALDLAWGSYQLFAFERLLNTPEIDLTNIRIIFRDAIYQGSTAFVNVMLKVVPHETLYNDEGLPDNEAPLVLAKSNKDQTMLALLQNKDVKESKGYGVLPQSQSFSGGIAAMRMASKPVLSEDKRRLEAIDLKIKIQNILDQNKRKLISYPTAVTQRSRGYIQFDKEGVNNASDLLSCRDMLDKLLQWRYPEKPQPTVNLQLEDDSIYIYGLSSEKLKGILELSFLEINVLLKDKLNNAQEKSQLFSVKCICVPIDNQSGRYKFLINEYFNAFFARMYDHVKRPMAFFKDDSTILIEKISLAALREVIDRERSKLLESENSHLSFS